MLKLEAPIDEEWMDDVSELLHDSLVVREAPCDSGCGRYELELRRVGYEHGRQEPRLLGLLKRWHFPRVPTRVVVEPVVAVRTIAAEAGPEIDQVLGLELGSGAGTLTVSRDFGRTVIELGPEPRLSVTDLGEPSDDQGVTDVGGRLVAPGWIDELAARKGRR